MNFRTVINIDPSPHKITYSDKVMFIGSCFAAYMGERMKISKMPVMINPAGTVYNPVSVLNTLDSVISGKIISQADLFNYDGTWLSFFHYTDFTSDDPETLKNKINDQTLSAMDFLGKSGFLFITFGTARIYRWKKSGIIVSNCHKIPDSQFETELITVTDIVSQWDGFLDRLAAFNPNLKVVFTISPVRHWKDGAHGNQVSKSVLFLAVEELLKHKIKAQYFPAYEFLIDDLRDYRFYGDDMLHPSASAVDYIWEKFTDSYLDPSTVTLQNEILKITKACNHRFITDSLSRRKVFAEKILKQITEIQKRNNTIDFTTEIEYFRKLAEK
jgi:hypothetical protein